MIKPVEEIVSIDKLKPHPRNYNDHPDDQIAHIVKRIEQYGIYRRIVVATDYTILAGHGVVKALKSMGDTEVPITKVDINPESPEAIKLLVGDNEVSHLAEKDDRLLTELLKEVKEANIDGLLGTGYDEMMLANLVFVTRMQNEIADFNEAAEWVGMPEYEDGEDQGSIIKVTISFRDETDKMRFAGILGLNFTDKTKSTWWPAKEKEDISSLRIVS